MTIQTLENININELLDAFNQSFSDYLIPVQLNLSQLEGKLRSDNTKLEYSIGAFDNGQLVGFILHGHDMIDGQSVLYNGGTGVIPEKRGRGLTEQMYHQTLPSFREKEIKKVILEVITTNAKAVKVYKRIGFETVRELDCYKGNINITESPDVEIRQLENINWNEVRHFWDWHPTWQNSINSIIRAGEALVSLGIYKSGNLCGYAVYNPQSKRMSEFAVDPKYRKQGLGTALFSYIGQHYSPELSIINVEKNQAATEKFLTSAGFHSYIQQFEMEMIL